MIGRWCVICALLLAALLQPAGVRADTYVIPFSDIQQIIDSSNESPDAAIRAYLAGLLRDELDNLGFDVNGGLVLDGIPVDAITEIIETDCNFPRPFEVHTDASTATVSLDDGSGLTLGLDSIRTVALHADLVGSASTESDAWVRWGQDIPFVGDCIKFETDHGWVGLTLPFDVGLDLIVDLDPYYDADLLAIVVDKQASLSGQATITGGELEHDFGSFSLTDALIDIFEDELLEAVQTNGEEAVVDAIAELNLRLDGLDENGNPDPAITPFNGPTVFALDIDEEDQAFVRDLLQQLGVPEFLITLLDERGIDILLQLVLLEGAEREAYLAELGATVSCEVLLSAFETPLGSTPIYRFDGQACSVADLDNPAAGTYFTDALCTNAVAYEVTDDGEYCATRFGDEAESLLGNAAGWTADANQPNDPLPAVPSRPWTTTPSTQLDVGVVSLQGNHQPYMKQFSYKTVANVPRGNGSCELEMRVYKSDIAGQDLNPLMALHGGTWQHRGFSFFGLEAGISHFTERGFIVFAPFYRLVGASDGNVECNGVGWRELTDDVSSALDWIAANGAALGAADRPVTVFGQSAGAHLAAWLAAHRPAEVRKALLFYAPTDTLEFLAGAWPPGGPYDAYRSFGTRSIGRLFGALNVAQELHFEQIDFANATVAQLGSDWATLIPDTVFDISQVDPQAPPVYLARCAAITATDLSAIDLSSPPAAIVDCLKQDLRDFLIDNSFNHQLQGEAVPIHVLHGSGDTLVPYTQALSLCAAIDGNAQPAEISEPLTAYACGTASEVQIVKDAEHALELGVCLDSLCPAGEIGSDTRAAATTAIGVAYDWLLIDPPVPPPEPVAVISLPDLNLNGAAELGALLRGDSNYVSIVDGLTGAEINNIDFGGDRDAMDVGVADIGGSPAIALLARDPTGRAWVEVRDAHSGTLVRDVWFSSGYSPLALAVLPDSNGNASSELAVLMTKDADGRAWVHIRDALSGAVVKDTWFEIGYTPVDLEFLPNVDANPGVEIAVLMTRNSDNRTWVHVKDAGSGAYIRNVWFESGFSPVDLAVVADPGNGTAAGLAVLTVRDSDQRSWVHLKDPATGAYVKNVAFSAGFSPRGLAVLPGLDANAGDELAVLATRDADGRTWVHVRDALTGAYIRDAWFQGDFSPAGFAVLPDTDANPGGEIAVLGNRGNGDVQLEIKDAASNALIKLVNFP